MQHVSKCLCTVTIGTKHCGTSHVRLRLQVKSKNQLSEGGAQITAHEPLAAQRNELKKKKSTALDRALRSHHISAFLSLSPSFFFIYRFPSLLSSCPFLLTQLSRLLVLSQSNPWPRNNIEIQSKQLDLLIIQKLLNYSRVLASFLFAFKATVINFQSCCYQKGPF